ncbi:MAG TPA: hypothetical protein VEQ85_08710, partial [Lacipirellulaceae bacterium]|nr:hypothetical protein [Lacipirellulaceae bacterium]
MPAIFPLLNLPAACALGLAVAFALGALALRRRRAPGAAAADGAFTEERSRAAQLAAELLRLSRGLESEAASHRRCVADFARALARLERAGGTNQWAGLRSCADQLVAPTLALATSLRLASDELNASLASLSAFSGSRIDAATNLHNRRSLQERLEAFFSMHAAGRRRFALAMFHASPADDDAEQTADGRLRDIAQL